MLEITPEVRDAIVAHALRSRPEEACGMVSAVMAGSSGAALVDRFHPLRNDAESATRFRLDPAEMLELERVAEAERRDLVGIVHSHVDTSAWPSPTDVADSTVYDPDGTFHQLIVSLRPTSPSLRCFRIRGGEVLEELLVVADPDATTHDESGAVAAVMQLPTRPRSRD